MVERAGPAISVAARPRFHGEGRGVNRGAHDRQDPRRFYDRAVVAATGAGFEVRLDGRAPRSPGARPLDLPTPALAELVAAEWNAQEGVIVFASMPATRLAYAALDAGDAGKEEWVASIVGYARADLLCYFAEGPRSLVERQTAAWAPLLAWTRDEMNLTFTPAAGIIHREQPPQTLGQIERLALGLDDFTLAGAAFATALFGSVILAFALMKGRIEAPAAFAASRLDEAFQEERWGLDSEAAARSGRLAADALMLQRWFAALGPYHPCR